MKKFLINAIILSFLAMTLLINICKAETFYTGALTGKIINKFYTADGTEVPLTAIQGLVARLHEIQDGINANSQGIINNAVSVGTKVNQESFDELENYIKTDVEELETVAQTLVGAINEHEGDIIGLATDIAELEKTSMVHVTELTTENISAFRYATDEGFYVQRSNSSATLDRGYPWQNVGGTLMVLPAGKFQGKDYALQVFVSLMDGRVATRVCLVQGNVETWTEWSINE